MAEEAEKRSRRAEEDAVSISRLRAEAQAQSRAAKSTVLRCKAAHEAIRDAAAGMRELPQMVRVETATTSAELGELGRALADAVSLSQTKAQEADRRFMRESRERRRAFN